MEDSQTDIALSNKSDLMILQKDVMRRQISNMNLLVGGNKKLFTPEELSNLAVEYFTYCIDNPIKSNQLITGGNMGGKVVSVDKPRMFTVEGFCLFCGTNSKYLYHLEESVRDKTDDESIRYSNTINSIREVIRLQRFENAAVNEMNPMFIAKLEGLTDKVEHSGEVKNTVTSITFVRQAVEDADYTEVNQMLDEE